MRVLSAWAGPLEREAGWGVVRQLFGPTAAGPEWEHLGVGAAALARRVLDPDPFAPAPTGDAVHAASYGLSWLAYGLAERDAHAAGGRRRALGGRAVAALAGPAERSPGRPAPGGAVRGALGGAGDGARDVGRPDRRGTGATAATETAGSGRGRDAGDRAASRRRPGVRRCLPRRQRRQPVPARRPRRPGDRRRGRAVLRGRGEAHHVRPGAGGPERRGPARATARRAPPTWPAPSRSSVAERCCARPRRSPVSTSSALTTWPTGWWPAASSDEPMTGSR